MTLDNRRRSPWREPMVWMLAAIPAAAIIAGIALVTIASRSGGNDAVADPVRRTAQIQVTDLGPDARARQLRLTAIVRSGKGLVEVLPVNGTYDRATPLTLSLRHPARAELDRELALAPTRTGWRVEEALDLRHDWNVQLGPADGNWRLQGRWPAGQQATYLQPAIGSE